MSDPYDALLAADDVLRGLAVRVGRPDPFSWPGADPAGDDRFVGLVLHVVGQQISTAAALAIHQRVQEAAGRVDPAALLGLGADRLRGAGLSRAKTTSLLDLSQRVTDGVLDLRGLDRLGDDAVVSALSAVRGIGPWTAQMFLIHQLHRPDVLPAGDLGIRHAVREAFALDGLPVVEDVAALARRWSPWRTYAAALLWASLRMPGKPVPDPDGSAPRSTPWRPSSR